tara:strand:+ start:47627 stop:48547 length:921 start_codon:yes stop_codon:yes gene_type:complete
MSTSATTAAKRRRAGNVVASPLFRQSPNPSSLDSVQRRVNRSTENLQNETIRQLNSVNPSTTTNNTVETTDFKKPMSLQQVITVFDKRLLTLEKAIIENKVPMESTTTNQNISNELNLEQTQKMIDTLREDLKITLTDQANEFDYRTNLLANEITNLKEIVIKLQSYTLEVNKSLYEEREQFINGSDSGIQIQSDEKLNEDDLEVIQDDVEPNISMELQETSETGINTIEELQEEPQEEPQELQNLENVEDENTSEHLETQDIDENNENHEEEEDAVEEDIVEEKSNTEKKSRRKKKEKKSLSVEL